MNRRHRLLAVVVLTSGISALVLTGVFVGVIPINWTSAPLSGLYLSVNPNTFRVAGDWNITAQFRASPDAPWRNVDLVVSAVMTFEGGSRYVEAKLLSGGHGEIDSLPGAVGVVFSGTYNNSSSAVQLGGPKVIPPYVAGIVVIASITTGLALALGVSVSSTSRRLGRMWGLLTLPGVVAMIAPVAYEAEYWPEWNGTGWLPSSFNGFPLWGFALLPLAATLATVGGMKLAERRLERMGVGAEAHGTFTEDRV